MQTYITTEIFNSIFGSNIESTRRYFAPARVNLIGEHIDYNGGKVLPAALDIGIEVLVRKRNDHSVMLYSEGKEGPLRIELNKTIQFKKERGWGNLPGGILKFLLEDNYKLPGLEIYFRSTMPESAGLSSSAAVGVLVAWLALSEAGEVPDRTYCAKIARRTENEFLGLNCGIMDPFVIAHGKKQNAILLNCATLDFEYIPVTFKNYEFVVLDSAQSRTLVGSEYNMRRAACEQAAEILGVDLLSEIEDIQELEKLTDPVIRKRARHVVSECIRVEQAADYLKSGNAEAFGSLLNASHSSLDVDFEVSTREINTLIALANAYPECLGARITGAGFGGCGVALIHQESLEDFTNVLKQQYFRASGLSCRIFSAILDDGVRTLDS